MRVRSLLALSGALILIPQAGYAFSAPIVQCGAVTSPAAISNCGSDPLGGGSVNISDEGELDLAIAGAGANETYAVVFRSPDGSQNVTITNNLVTGAKGSADLHKEIAFPLGKAGAGNIVITRGGNDQFLSGIAIEPSGGKHARADFRGRYARCGAINIFANPLSNCGSDPLKDGHVHVDAVDGDLNIQISGAAAHSQYDAILRDASGNSVDFGTFGTDAHGNGQLTKSGSFAASSTSAGTFVITRAGADQFLAGFRVTQKPLPKPAAGTGLVRCIDVSYGGALANCGTDPLHGGSAVLSHSGNLSVSISGAQPSTNYEVWFRPLNSDGSADIDTKVALATDTNGNAHASKQLPQSSGAIGSGTFVVKGAGFDQFVGGFILK